MIMLKKYKFYIDLIKKYKLLMFWGIVLLVLEGIIIVRLPFAMSKFINIFIDLRENNLNIFLKYIAIYIALYISQLILNYISSILFKDLGNRISKDVGNIVINKYCYAIRKKTQQFDSGDAMVMLNSDIFSIGERGVLLAYNLADILINIFGLFYYMWKSSIILSLFITLNFIVLMSVQYKFNNKIELKMKEMKKISGDYYNITSTISKESNEYRRTNILEYIYNKFLKKLIIYINYGMNIDKDILLNQLITGLGILLNVILIFVIGSIYTLRGLLGTSALITFNMYSNIFGGNIMRIPNIMIEIKSFNIVYNRLIKVLEIETYEGLEHGLKYIDRIELHNAKFSYDDKDSILESNMKFEKGNIYGIVGKNGSGKSTVLNIISGELILDSGDILINDQLIDIQKAKLYLDRYISYYSSKGIILNDDIRTNMDPYNLYTDCEIEDICKIVSINEWIDTLDEKIETKLNAIKRQVSDGQRQKICLARTLLENKEVMIFDEIEKHLDRNSKNKIIEYLNKIKRRKIIIIATHDEVIKDGCDIIAEI